MLYCFLDKIKDTNETFDDIANKRHLYPTVEFPNTIEVLHSGRGNNKICLNYGQTSEVNKMSLKQIKDLLAIHADDQAIVHGRGEVRTFDEWVDREYTMDTFRKNT